MFHAPPARTAADTLIGPVINIDRHIHHQFAEQQERAVTGRDEQRIASYETETRFAGEPFSSSGAVSVKALKPVPSSFSPNRAAVSYSISFTAT